MQTANKTTHREMTAHTTDQPATTTNPTASAAEHEEMRIPVVEERLHVEVRQGEAGEIRLQKHVERFEGTLERPLVRDDVTIERVTVERMVDRPEEPHYEGDVWVIPVMEEVLVVQKRLRVKEELRIHRRQVTEHHRIREELRRVRIDIENDGGDSTRPPGTQAPTPAASSPPSPAAASSTASTASAPARDTTPATKQP